MVSRTAPKSFSTGSVNGRQKSQDGMACHLKVRILCLQVSSISFWVRRAQIQGPPSARFGASARPSCSIKIFNRTLGVSPRPSLGLTTINLRGSPYHVTIASASTMAKSSDASSAKRADSSASSFNITAQRPCAAVDGTIHSLSFALRVLSVKASSKVLGLGLSLLLLLCLLWSLGSAASGTEASMSLSSMMSASMSPMSMTLPAMSLATNLKKKANNRQARIYM
mmetsp:Transcript_59437/g.125929  ORF Transcript_59437/g.125929 Transcript_59437/m.125929 type:complete len:225 (+) Transcript_59437:20-694(+)